MSGPAAKDRNSALGDAAERDYAGKLSLFFRLAEPELRRLITGLNLALGTRVLDAGCGAGQTAPLLAEQTGPTGMVVGLDLSRPHLSAGRQGSPGCWLQASLSEPPFPRGCFDAIWCANAVHHTHNPVRALLALREILRPGGRVALCQSALLPDMVFAWDNELEWAVHAACRRYYREKYGLGDDHAVAWRRGFGWLREAGFERPRADTIVIERTAPLDDATRAYLEKALFADYWGPKIDVHLSAAQVRRLRQWTNPDSADYALARADFHYIRTLTCFSGRKSLSHSHATSLSITG